MEKYKKKELFKRDIEKIFIIYLFIQGIKETMGKVKSNKRDKEFFKSTIQPAIIVIGINYESRQLLSYFTRKSICRHIRVRQEQTVVVTASSIGNIIYNEVNI